MTRRKFIFSLLAVFLTTAVVTGALVYTWTMHRFKDGKEIYIEANAYGDMFKYYELNDLKQIILDSYYKNVDEEDLLEGSLEGMVEALGDGYSAFYQEEDFVSFDEKSEGSYIAQGMMLKKDEETGYIEVTRVFPDTPADEHKIQAGDLITVIDGRDTRQIEVDNAAGRLRGIDGTTVEFTVLSGEKRINVSLVRKSSEVQVVFTDMVDDEIGYIHVLEFSGSSVDGFKEALENMKEEGAKAIVIDLRQNPGGNISQATEAADMLLDNGQICSTKDRKGQGSVWTADQEVLTDLPLVVLVDKDTAGAAEVFAAALQENGRATIMGEQTAGKGVQISLFQLPSSGDGIKLVTAQYLTPKGRMLHGTGVTPDVEKTLVDVESEEDPILLEAADLLRQNL